MLYKLKISIIASVIALTFLYSQVVYAFGIMPIFGFKNEPITIHNVGNRLTRTDSDGDYNYSYDNVYRLTTADSPDPLEDESYSYDGVGNRLTNQDYADWTYNAGNQLEGYNDTIFTYDNNGNTTTKQNTEGTTTYTWDYENRLTSVTTPTNSTAYYYDPFGKRLYKWADGVVTWYLYNHEDIIAEYDSSGTLLRSYIHGPGIDEPVRMTDESTGTNYYYLADGLGSVVELQDETGVTVETYRYDSFGNPTILDGEGTELTESAISNSYLFTGREYDSEIALYYYRARYYDSSIGRFLSEDPIRFYGGINFYLYVGNNPINWIDSFGLQWWVPSPSDPTDPRQMQSPHWFVMSREPRTKPADRPSDFFRHQKSSCNSRSDYENANVKCNYESLGETTETLPDRVRTENIGRPYKDNVWKMRVTQKDITATYYNFKRTCYRCARKCENGKLMYYWDKMSSEKDRYKAFEKFLEIVEYYGYDYAA